MARAGFHQNRPVVEIADILRRHGQDYARAHAAHHGRVERRVISAITACRTAALGGHVEACDDCGAMTALAANPRRLGARIGGLAILHTWGQALTHHPHVHCVVPGGVTRIAYNSCRNRHESTYTPNDEMMLDDYKCKDQTNDRDRYH